LADRFGGKNILDTWGKRNALGTIVLQFAPLQNKRSTLDVVLRDKMGSDVLLSDKFELSTTQNTNFYEIMIASMATKQTSSQKVLR